ncbi:DUF5700 domain-containing putative Zn-dependent protease [Bacillus sp. FJAT-45066]|uniref:DUF5700 domain-containing putative Zn-dependent protease n=1 Tax=Bacillus sp. FJAT-45066 TaxID=2011010 RepID=UPI000BB7BAF8|nr:DUF5700 domain-containing putative Zn-dependent protease [Bacillus sp. FJAT-45066]
MNIYNTVPYFLENFKTNKQLLQNYHEKFSPHFEEYFLYHCKNADEKRRAAIERYSTDINEIKECNRKIESFIRQVVNDYEVKYDIKFMNDVHIIVGCYGSNAFTHRQIIPDITFCLEKLSPKDEHLKVIIAHEFGHALHNKLTDLSGIDWSKLQWFHPYTWLLQEGCATYFSKQVTVVDEAVYFSYDDKGDEWLRFAQSNTEEIIATFLNESKTESHMDVFREWFSINGGTQYGHTRLGYYIGYIALKLLIQKFGELKAITLWKEPNFIEEMEQVLMEFKKS